jgi:VanZ family protein
VSSRCRSLLYWGPVVLWTLLIFWGSTDLGSERRTSRFIGPFLRWLAPGVSDATVESVQYTVRKAGHVSEYAVLAVLLWRALRRPVRDDRRPWSWRTAAATLALAALYAVSDEYHQSFVATRYASALDVISDTVGALAGLGAVWALGRWRRRW